MVWYGMVPVAEPRCGQKNFTVRSSTVTCAHHRHPKLHACTVLVVYVIDMGIVLRVDVYVMRINIHVVPMTSTIKTYYVLSQLDACGVVLRV